MHLTTLRTVGGSVMLSIPKPILEGLSLSANTQVGLRVDEGRLVVEPTRRPRYRLAELLAACDPTAAPSADEVAWDSAPPEGCELF